MENCVFCKIAMGELPSRKLYEDDEVLAFYDIHAQAPVHFMLIPKEHVVSLIQVNDSHQQVLGKMMVLASKLAKEQGLTDGFRVIVNSGAIAGQEVFHLHIHVAGGNKPLPPMLQRIN